MGLLVKGEWKDRWYETGSSGGRFKRAESSFRNWITRDGSPGPTGTGGFKAQSGRYHLYVSYACPWAHRTLIYRCLKSLTKTIDVSFVHWLMGVDGWTFEPDVHGVVGDKLFESKFLREIYLRADTEMSGRVTVPVLWDKEQQVIVSNESSEIIRMFDTAFNDVITSAPDFYPLSERKKIDSLNELIYRTVNNGVYKCGFATSQKAYEEAVLPLFETFDLIESMLSDQRYLLGDQPTEADWRLFPTLLRFDLIYYGHFKCNLRRLVDYPNLWAYTRDLYQQPGIAETCNFEHAKNHYYASHLTINPTGVVPTGPVLDFASPHGRD